MKRSKRKGPYQKNLLNFSEKMIRLPRNTEITSNLVGSDFFVYSGNKFVSITIIENMVGHRIGEFVPTRQKFEFKKKK